MGKDSCKDKVYKVLSEIADTKDNDWRLLTEYYSRYYGCTEIKELSLIKGVSAVETVRRARQWWQEHYPELRGESYAPRQKKARKVSKGFANNEFPLEDGVSINLN